MNFTQNDLVKEQKEMKKKMEAMRKTREEKIEEIKMNAGVSMILVAILLPIIYILCWAVAALFVYAAVLQFGAIGPFYMMVFSSGGGLALTIGVLKVMKRIANKIKKGVDRQMLDLEMKELE